MPLLSGLTHGTAVSHTVKRHSQKTQTIQHMTSLRRLLNEQRTTRTALNTANTHRNASQNSPALPRNRPRTPHRGVTISTPRSLTHTLAMVTPISMIQLTMPAWKITNLLLDVAHVRFRTMTVCPCSGWVCLVAQQLLTHRTVTAVIIKLTTSDNAIFSKTMKSSVPTKQTIWIRILAIKNRMLPTSG